MQVDPIHQFEIKNFVPLFNLGGHEISFTNSALYMFIIVGLTSVLLIGGTMRRAVVPGRLQSIAEICYEFVANTVRSSAGTEGMKFFPFVFTLFMFVLAANLIVAIEVLSFLSRPVSHSVRLFANMLAGHITLQVFAGFVIMLGSAGILGIFGATLPFIMVVLLFALELLVAFLQAYVFAILTCIYLNDAIHPGH